MPNWSIEGHAIVSADQRIADATGRTPAALRNPADWRRFQAELGRAAVIVLGRLGHQINPNPQRRNRLVLSSGVHGLERRADAWWWNPATVPLAEALAAAAPGGGLVAVPGGRRVFDYFLAAGYDAFHLAEAHRVTVGEGVPVFTGAGPARPAADFLRGSGLRAEPTVALDPAAGVDLTIWRR